MSRGMWILAAALAVLVGAQIFAGEGGWLADRPWTQCKESFVQQMLSDDCTPVRGIAIEPSQDGGASGGAGSSAGDDQPAMIPADDGIDRVDRGG